MAAELFKPFVIRKLIERGIVKTVKSAKKLVDRKDSVIWEILENIFKDIRYCSTGHRHCTDCQFRRFQPKLVEGKAIQITPSCLWCI